MEVISIGHKALTCHGDWSMASPPTCQEVIDVTSTRPLSKDFDVKRFGLNTTSRILSFGVKTAKICEPAKYSLAYLTCDM